MTISNRDGSLHLIAFDGSFSGIRSSWVSWLQLLNPCLVMTRPPTMKINPYADAAWGGQ